jgi:hypothetical protein
MKTLLKIFLISFLTGGILNFATAQRTRGNNGSSDNNNSRGNVSQHVDRGNRGSAMQPATNRGGISERSVVIRSSQRNSDNMRPAGPDRNAGFDRTSPQRTIDSRQNYSRQYSSIRDNRNYINNSNYRYNNSRYNSYYRTSYVHRPVFMYGPRYTVIPRSSVSIYFGGNPYYYNSGYFYGYYGGYYQPLFPPFGIRVGFLPFGYSRIFIGVDPFFYYNGIYYRQYDDNSYEVVDAPMGATVSSLPRGAKSVVVNGEKLYELNGTYYKSDRDSKGNNVYTVVGKNGEINNTDEGDVNNQAPLSNLQIGDVVNQLPEGSKVVTINGEKTYLTPDGTYLKEESVNGNVQYEVIGK